MLCTVGSKDARSSRRRVIIAGFLKLLEEVHERYRFVIHAYCLLGSHYHAIVQTPDGNLSRGMQWLGLAYSSSFNAKRRRRGRLRAHVTFEDGVYAVEQARGEERTSWLRKHGDWGKWLVLHLARRYTGMTRSALGHQLGSMDYAAVSVGLRRFEKHLQSRRSITDAMIRTCKMLNV